MADHTPGARPLHDLAAEKTVLHAILRSPRAVPDIVEILVGEDFYSPAHILIYQSALALYAQDDTVDPLTVASELDRHDHLAEVGGADYLVSLASAPGGPGSWAKAADTVQALAVLRRLRETTAHIDNLAADGTATDAERIINTAQAEVHAATSRRPWPLPPSRPLAEVLEGALDEMEAIGSRAGQPHGIPTGFHDLDSLTGGLHPGQLIVIAGRAAMGTSTLVLKLLRHASIEQRLPAALFALESRSTDIAQRLLAAQARVPLHHMRSGTMTDHDWNRIAYCISRITDAPLYLQDDPYANFTELRAHCRRLHHLHREGAYDKESPRSDEADLLIAKHRYGPTADLVIAEQLMFGRFLDMQPGRDPLLEEEALPAPRTALNTDTHHDTSDEAP